MTQILTRDSLTNKQNNSKQVNMPLKSISRIIMLRSIIILKQDKKFECSNLNLWMCLQGLYGN